MPEAFVDTNVLIRFLTGDDLARQTACARLFERIGAGEVVVRAPVTVVADAVYVLTSKALYGLPRAEVAELLLGIVGFEGFRVDSKQRVARALEIFGSANVDFGDAMLAASMEAEDADDIYSYDRDFARLGLNLLTPG